MCPNDSQFKHAFLGKVIMFRTWFVRTLWCNLNGSNCRLAGSDLPKLSTGVACHFYFPSFSTHTLPAGPSGTKNLKRWDNPSLEHRRDR